MELFLDTTNAPAGDPVTILLLVAVVLGAAAQALTGIGFALVATPLLIALLGPGEGVAVSLVLASVANAIPLAAHWREVAVGPGVGLLVPAALATPLVAVALRRVDLLVARGLAGASILTAAAMLAFGARWHAAAGRRGAVGAGIASAAMNYVGGVGGPAVALYASNAGWPGERTRATLQAYLLALNVVTLAALGFAAVSLDLLVALGTGSALGLWAAQRVSEAHVRAAIVVLAAGGGAFLLVGALAGAR